MEDYTKVIAVLNDLIKINGDRITEYEKAAASLNNSELMLKALFYQMSDESLEINYHLADKVIELGGEPANESSVPGRIYHLWKDIRATFSGEDTAALTVLEMCDFGEDATQWAYKEVIEQSNDFPEEIRRMIMKQQFLLKMSQDLIRNQRNQDHEVTR
ncbi:MAG TPA: PA2169 family four-helix-bundle protein [Cyclobacteriaceae bacterium]|nr:PA2169 family four-helix-bundle protein [Cyclobacteriaceae bacterium]